MGKSLSFVRPRERPKVNPRRASRRKLHPVCRRRAARGMDTASEGRCDSEGSEGNAALPSAPRFPHAGAGSTFTPWRNDTATRRGQEAPTPTSARFGTAVRARSLNRRHTRASAARIRTSPHRGLSTLPCPARSKMVLKVLGVRSEARPNHSLKPPRYGSHRLAAPGHSGHCPSAASRRLPQRAA